MSSGFFFGFFPNKNKNLRYPHIGIVIINENCEIPVEALKELSEVMSNLENAFSNAGFVLPYNELEETGIE